MDNLDTPPVAIKDTMIANGTAAPVAKGKITAAQIRNNCPVELENLCKQVAAHHEREYKYQKKLGDIADTIAKLLVLIAEACDDEEAFEACRRKFYPELGRSRVYELKAIAAGKKTPEQIRAETRERVARHRARQSVTAHVTDNGTGDIAANTAGNGTSSDGDNTGKEYVGIDHHDDDDHGGSEQLHDTDGRDRPGNGLKVEPATLPKPTFVDLWREAPPQQRLADIGCILEGVEIEDFRLVLAKVPHLRRGLESRLINLHGLKRSDQLTKILQRALHSPSAAERDTAITQMNKVLAANNFSFADVHVRVPKAKR